MHLPLEQSEGQRSTVEHLLDFAFFVYFDCCLFFFSTFLWWSWNHLAQFANRAAVAWWWTNLSFLATVLDLLRGSDFPRKLLWGGVDGRSNSSRILRKKPKWLTLRFNGDSPWDVVIRAILDLGCSLFLSGSDAANPFSLVQQSVEVVHTTRPTHLVHTRIQRNSLSWWSSVAEYDQTLWPLHNSQLSTENRIDVCHQVVRACCVLLKNSAISLCFLRFLDQLWNWQTRHCVVFHRFACYGHQCPR